MKRSHTLKGFSLVKFLITFALCGIILVASFLALVAWILSPDNSDDDAKITEEQIIEYLSVTYGGEFECLEFKQPRGGDERQGCKFRDSSGIEFYVTLINNTEGRYTQRFANDHYKAGFAENNQLLETIQAAGYDASVPFSHGSIIVQVSGKDEAMAAAKYLWTLLRDEKYACRPVISSVLVSAQKYGNQGIEPDEFRIELKDGSKVLSYFSLPILRDGEVVYTNGAGADEAASFAAQSYS